EGRSSGKSPPVSMKFPLGWSTRSSRAYVSREPDGYDSSNSDRPPTEIGPVIADHVQSPAFIADQPISRRRNGQRHTFPPITATFGRPVAGSACEDLGPAIEGSTDHRWPLVLRASRL